MTTPEQIREDLANSSTQCVVHNHGYCGHPWNGEITVGAVSLFSTSKIHLEEEVKSYQEYGWLVWIIGTTDGIPAAYLYKELE